MSQTGMKNDDMAAYWMPFTPNRVFKASPRIFERSEGQFYYTSDGRRIRDGFSGMWCSNLGHCHPKITEAIRKQAGKLDYSAAFNFGHSQAFELANVIANQFPGDLNHVFFTNSGSEAVDTALKMAIAYHRINGEGTRTRLIGRVLGYHGVGFGGISVGGMVNNRKFFGSLLPGVDHLSLPYIPSESAFTRGLTDEDIDFYGQELENIIALHDASTIAAVIMEPVVGSGGVFVPPKGYIKRMREITKKHGILLILDEVITAFGRLGKASAGEYFGVEADIVSLAKGINNGTVPMGAVVAQKKIYDTFINGTKAGVEFFHGFTYSAHPLATAAALATQEVIAEEGVYEQVQALSGYFESLMHSLKDEPYVADVRNLGFMGGLTLEQRDGVMGARAYDLYIAAYEAGVSIRNNGDTVAIAPILTSGKEDLEDVIERTRKALRAID